MYGMCEAKGASYIENAQCPGNGDLSAICIPCSLDNPAAGPVGDTVAGIVEGTAGPRAPGKVGPGAVRIALEADTPAAPGTDKPVAERILLMGPLDYKEQNSGTDNPQDRTGPRFHPWMAHSKNWEAPAQLLDWELLCFGKMDRIDIQGFRSTMISTRPMRYCLLHCHLSPQRDNLQNKRLV